MLVRALTCGVLIGLGGMLCSGEQTIARAQDAAEPQVEPTPAAADQSATTEPAPATETQPATEPAPVTDTPAAEPAPKPAVVIDEAAAADFDAAFAEWNTLLEKIREVQVRYKIVEPKDRAEVRKEFEQLVAEGNALAPRLRKAAVNAYLKAPNQQTKVSDILTSLLIQANRQQQYSETLELGQLLIDHHYQNPRIYGPTGEAAFELDRFDEAKQLLDAGDAKNALSETQKDLRHALEEPVRIVARDVQRDDYETALRRAKFFVEANRTTRELFNQAGVAAYQAGDYALAEEWLSTAKNLGSLTADAKVLLDGLPKTKELWAAEQAIRQAEAAADDLPRVELTTSQGPVVVELFENEAPNTVANFISLVEKGFYNNTPFHRVLPGFMAQGGDPTGTGMGGPGYTIDCETTAPNARNHFRGSLSMAKSAEPNSGGSQFFLTFVRTHHLDGQHTVFGRVVDGTDVLAKLTPRDPSGMQQLSDPDRIIKAKVLRKRDHAYVPKTSVSK